MKNPCFKNNSFIFSMIAIMLIFVFVPISAHSFIEKKEDCVNRDDSLLENFAWERILNGINEFEVVSIEFHPNKQEIIYVATSKALYVSNDKGESFSSVFYIKGSQATISDVFIGDNSIYVVSDSDVFFSCDGKDWRKIFSSDMSRNQRCFSVLDTKERIYVATSIGLFFRLKSDLVWKKMTGELGLNPVFLIRSEKDRIYVSTENNLFKFLDRDMKVERIFSGSSFLRDSENVDSFDNYQDLFYFREILDFSILSSGIFMATRNGILYRSNSDKSWKNISVQGFSPKDIVSIDVVDENQMIVASKKGVFVFSNNQWAQLYKGMLSSSISCLGCTKQGEIFAGSPKGLFALKKQIESVRSFPGDYRKVRKFFESEPSIQYVQRMAIEYAEVSPNKVKQWRQQAKRKAWLPDLSIGVDGNKNLTTSDSVYGSYSSGGQQYVGSDDKTFYNNFGWDVSLSWDLGDIIWNSDQTSIDSRSKLMVELREDILDEVTRLYFERRRIQIKILTDNAQEMQNLVDQQMRIEELTALIDALTGGQFSQEINSSN